MDFEVRQDHGITPRTLSSRPCAKLSKRGLSGVCSWDPSCPQQDIYSQARRPSSAVIPTAPVTRWSPQITYIKYSLRDSTANFHWVCFKFLSNILYFFSWIDMCCISSGYLERKEIKPHPDHDFIPPNIYIFFFNFTLQDLAGPSTQLVEMGLILLAATPLYPW